MPASPLRHLFRVAPFALALLASAVSARFAGAACLGEPGQRVGLALSGGAARGIAQVGVLSVLEEQGVRVGCIAGTSMGAIVGALYASGYPVARIEALVRSIDWQQMFSPKPERELVPLAQRLDLAPATVRLGFDWWKPNVPKALASDYRLNRMLTELLAGPGLGADGDFDRLPIPFRAVATDLQTGEQVVLGSGNLERAVRASLAFPPRLLPVPHGERLLVDGGLVDNVPVDAARALGADIVIAVDTSLPPLPPGKYQDAAGVLYKIVQLLMERRNRDFAQAADLTVTPDLQGFEEQHYERHEEILARGRQAALQELPQLKARLASGRAPTPGANGSEPPSTSTGVPASAGGRQVRRVGVEGNQVTREGFIEDTFDVRAGAPLEPDRVLRGIDALHATRLFDSIWVEMQPAGSDAVELAVHVREAPRRVLELSVAVDEADNAAGLLRLRNRNVFGAGENLALTALASSAQAGLRATLAGDRLGPMRAFGFYGRAERFDDMPRVFHDGELTGRAEFERTLLALGLQRRLGPAALLRAGLGVGRVTIEPRAAFAPAPPTNGSDGVRAVELAAVWDTLDDRWLPTRGARLAIAVDRSLPGLGATHRYWRVLGRGQGALPLPVGILQAEAFAGVSGGDVPPYDLFRIGGPSLMPGLHRDELWGPQAVGVAIAHGVGLGPLRFTARLGGGQTFSERREIALGALRFGWGVSVERSTRFGPVMFGWGHSADTGSRFYFSAGPPLRF